MPKNRFKIDINDNDGNKIVISLEGRLTREKILHLLDLVDLLGGSTIGDAKPERSNLTKFKKLENIIFMKFPIGWFSSQEIMMVYEDTLDEPIGLSTVSTYLNRLAKKGILTKSGSAAKRRYRVMNNINENKRTKYNVRP